MLLISLFAGLARTTSSSINDTAVQVISPIAVTVTYKSTSYDSDPYLQYRPPFVRSLPVQILLTGIVLTLVAVLFIHLIFTAQYHWPLAPVNYVLQLSGVTTLLISLIATLHVVLSTTMVESQHWPYMLSYIAVNVPPLDVETSTTDWSVAEKATWLVMNASTSGLIQITHIQFLTLLYPSRLEGRLIFTLLGPLAIVAAVMQLIPIQGTNTADQVVIIAAAVRNVCNATLSLLFTVALFIWGFLVNRRQAWRTDGGTAAFGVAALALALVSTALNFVYVDREEEYVWLPGLMWAVILWQSFLGWWWWVGAGSGCGLSSAADTSEVEERLRREERRESRRREAKERRNTTRMRAKNVLKGVTGAFGTREDRSISPPNLHRRFSEDIETDSTTTTVARQSTSGVSNSADNEQLHFGQSSRRRRRRQSRNTRVSDESMAHEHESETASDADAATVQNSVDVPSAITSPKGFTDNLRVLLEVVHSWYASLRHAHVAAARLQEVERAERIREFGERHRRVVTNTDRGWGLGSFGWRLGRNANVETERYGAERAMDARLGRGVDGGRGRWRRGDKDQNNGNEFEMQASEAGRSRWDLSQRPELTRDGSRNSGPSSGDRRLSIRMGSEATLGDQASFSKTGSEPSTDRRSEYPYSYPASSIRTDPRSPSSVTPNPYPPMTIPPPTHQRSMWWWGPLRRWRLQDTTIY
ncbi:hypothetical protein AX17_004550 [Amanita inopinata Kibby_2008]|nr:hypothetical protein AX17_004550 [Amanita inopinata Kibby_2008]